MLVYWSVYWTILSVHVYRERVGYRKVKEGTEIGLEVCCADQMGGLTCQ